uniref:EF-hand domain-containing protein n=1 Tax=Chromera velia CCMP2878 TaxID=1169474 RepID=A0A0G4GHU0_9ALVE|mmetsp:Transcript_16352/g.33223  ORF Transcript_16352/g.33223 Transcript_16352/m.33223 type:complete len:182 (+) Transcript_16352:3-548(+)|eukprot:Cvel_4723.t1-p1 / transcript=Cvel_4723.t1 / gene=Cvel_4723 / organism=Chromera_velia_CCMP2878 / gene_product=hypothetical protein / transcript_product=hypothetical protein / location=Cvel_scaffold210:11448-13191(+) / protein_length=181 / sequence_SO=supercontig / SO=protein_coding / is_pseudo=false
MGCGASSGKNGAGGTDKKVNVDAFDLEVNPKILSIQQLLSEMMALPQWTKMAEHAFDQGDKENTGQVPMKEVLKMIRQTQEAMAYELFPNMDVSRLDQDLIQGIFKKQHKLINQTVNQAEFVELSSEYFKDYIIKKAGELLNARDVPTEGGHGEQIGKVEHVIDRLSARLRNLKDVNPHTL